MITDYTVTDAPQAWIGCMACYNNGLLNGEWIDPTTDDVPITCPMCGGEEFHVYEHEGFGGFLDGECSPQAATDAANLIEAIRNDGYDPTPVGMWRYELGMDWTEWDGPTAEDFDEAYVGEYQTFRDYSDDLVYETVFTTDTSDTVRQYFDYEMFARDLMMDHFTVDGGIGVYVFRSI